MKTQTGYIYPEGISAERKPVFGLRKYLTLEERLNNQATLKEWEKTLIPVKNARKSDLSFIGGAWKDRWYITTVINEADYEQILTPGQKVQHNEGEITKIL